MMNKKLMLAAMMTATMAEIFPAPLGTRDRRDGEGSTPKPTEDKEAQMRRELADCQAHKDRLAAAKAKRERKSAKRVADAKKVGAGGTAPEGHNQVLDQLCTVEAYITMRETREDRKHRLSIKASRAVQMRWDRYHAECPAPVYDQHHAYGEYEITIKSLRSGKVNVLMLHEGPRRDNFFAELNGEAWKPERVSISTVTRIIRESIVKTRSGRIV